MQLCNCVLWLRIWSIIFCDMHFSNQKKTVIHPVMSLGLYCSTTPNFKLLLSQERMAMELMWFCLYSTCSYLTVQSIDYSKCFLNNCSSCSERAHVPLFLGSDNSHKDRLDVCLLYEVCYVDWVLFLIVWYLLLFFFPLRIELPIFNFPTLQLSVLHFPQLCIQCFCLLSTKPRHLRTKISSYQLVYS